MVLGLGLVFQMPMLVFFLARFGIVTARFMLKQFKYAVLIIFILAAVITPSGDPVNLTMFSAPDARALRAQHRRGLDVRQEAAGDESDDE